MSFTDTPEQAAIFAAMQQDHAARHLLIDAKAGAGKTSTIIKGLPLLAGSRLLMAFNRSIADDIKAKVSELDFSTKAQTQVSTVHAHGLSALKAGGQKPQVQGGKLHFLLRDQAKSWSDRDLAHKNTRHISKLASFAKNAGFGLTACDGREHFPAIADKDAWLELVEHFNLDTELEGGYEVAELIDEAIDLLLLSNKKLGMIDFDDMVYLPLLLDLPIRQYDNVLVDEAQDINATRRELAFRSLAPSGRLIAVGDPNQAIYGFTGASVDSMNEVARRLDNPLWLPLSICWRCDDEILKIARKIVPTIQTAPAKVDKGQVLSIPFRMEPNPQEREGYDFLAMPQAGDAILCRLNRPNVATALGLLRRGTPARIEGRDLGKKLLEHVKKANESYGYQPLADTLYDVEAYRDVECMKLANKDREAAAELLRDECDAALLLIERCIEQEPGAKWPQLEMLVESLFGDDVKPSSCVTLSSIHKAKGREWPRVFALGYYDYQPFWKAEEGWQLEQEHNLQYVLITRAERELVFVTGVQAALDKGLHRLPPLAQKAS